MPDCICVVTGYGFVRNPRCGIHGIQQAFKEARERIETGPAWLKQACANDYSARRQIKEKANGLPPNKI